MWRLTYKYEIGAVGKKYIGLLCAGSVRITSQSAYRRNYFDKLKNQRPLFLQFLLENECYIVIFILQLFPISFYNKQTFLIEQPLYWR